MNDNKNLNFVLHHYRDGALDTQKALREVEMKAGGQPSASRRPALRRWVAVAASLLCLVAFAAVLTIYRSHTTRTTDTAAPSPTVVASRQSTDSTAREPNTFHFDNTPLPEVLADLSAYYGVVLVADREDCRLTGYFTADSLDVTIRLIEEVLDVDISQRQK